VLSVKWLAGKDAGRGNLRVMQAQMEILRFEAILEQPRKTKINPITEPCEMQRDFFFQHNHSHKQEQRMEMYQ